MKLAPSAVPRCNPQARWTSGTRSMSLCIEFLSFQGYTQWEPLVCELVASRKLTLRIVIFSVVKGRWWAVLVSITGLCRNTCSLLWLMLVKLILLDVTHTWHIRGRSWGGRGLPFCISHCTSVTHFFRDVMSSWSMCISFRTAALLIEMRIWEDVPWKLMLREVGWIEYFQ